MACIFCNILAKEVPAEIIYENDVSIAILDVNPIHYGHALIIPKQHYPDFLDAPQKDLAGIFDAAHKVTKALVKTYNLEGFNFFSNNGRIAGQSVFHFHVHITPRFKDDNIRFILQLKRYEGRHMQETAEKIRLSLHS